MASRTHEVRFVFAVEIDDTAERLSSSAEWSTDLRPQRGGTNDISVLRDSFGARTKIPVLFSSLNWGEEAVDSTILNGDPVESENSSGDAELFVMTSGRVYDGCSLGSVVDTLNFSLHLSESSSRGVIVSLTSRSLSSGCLLDDRPDASGTSRVWLPWPTNIASNEPT